MANVQIDINARDNTAAGFSSAANNAQQFSEQMRQVNNRLAQNYVASQQSAKEIAAMNQQFYATKTSATSAAGGISALAQGYKFLVGTALTAGTMRLAKQTYELSRMGAEADYTRIKFDRLSQSVGTTGDAFLNQLRTATKGTISDFAAMKQGADLLQLGLAKDSNEAIRLSRVMTALNMDTGELTLALANQSKRRLDQLGLSLSMFNKIESKLKDQGLTKEEAFKQAFIQTAEQTVALTGNMADTKLGDYMRFEARKENIKTGFGEWLASWAVKDTPYQGYAGNMAFVRDSADFADRARNPYTRNQPGNEIARQSSYEAMARFYMQPKDVGAGGEGATLDYEALLAGSLKLTSANEKFAAAQMEIEDNFRSSKYVTDLYRDSVNEVTRAYRNGELTLAQYREQTAQLQKDFKSGKFAKTQKGKQTGQVTAAAEEMGFGMVLSNMQAGGADPQTMLDYARATGMVTDEAYAAQSAFLTLSEYAQKGKEELKASAQATKLISGGLTKLDGAQYTAYVNIILRVFGANGGANWVKLNRESGAAVQVCFVPGTLILMEGMTYKPIEDVQIGDKVISYDFAHDKFISAPVGKVYHHEAKDMGRYYLLVNGSIGVTPNHPLFINGKWQNAEALKFGDVLKTPEGTIPVLSIEEVYEQVETYNLHIEDENHNYFADGILAHNKAGGGWVTAPGDGRIDTIMVPLANNEFVVNAKQAKRYKNLLEAINDGKMVGGMAGGGMVTSGRSAYTAPPSWMSNIGRRGGRGRSSSSATGISSGMTSDSISASAFTVAQEGGMIQGGGGGSSQAVEKNNTFLASIDEKLEILIGKTASASDIGRAVAGKGALQA